LIRNVWNEEDLEVERRINIKFHNIINWEEVFRFIAFGLADQIRWKLFTRCVTAPFIKAP